MPYSSKTAPKRSFHRSGPLSRLLLVATGPLMLALGCGEDVTRNYITNVYGDGGADDQPPVTSAGKGGSGGKGGSSGSSSQGGDTGEAGGSGGEAGEYVSPYPGAPQADTAVADHEPDLFGVIGNRFWFGVSDEQLEQMNALAGGGGPWNPYGDIYQPGGGSGEGNYADHLWVTTAGADPKTADYGQVQVKIVGQSTMRQWTPTSIPNLNVDFDEFVEDQRIGVFEHLRFNNALVGSIFRERITLELYNRLGYPAPRTTYAWVSSNVWGPNIAVPYIMVERYKPTFCEHQKDNIGGGCANIWEFAGDLGGYWGYPGEDAPSVFDDPEVCEFNECDNTRAKEFETAVRETPEGPGYKAALASWLDWPSFHAFQCLSWILATGDDALHNTNNVVIMERGDGLFQYLPYSVDISLGQEWYPTVPLPGSNSIARGCQSDDVCWEDTIATCEQLITDFTALDPGALLDSVYEQLTDEGMIRSGDEGRYEFLSNWFESRLVDLPVELEYFREPPMCPYPDMVDCGGYCDYYWNCEGNCGPMPPPPIMEAAGGAPGAGGAGAVGDAGAGGSPDVGQGGGGGVVCNPIEYYGL